MHKKTVTKAATIIALALMSGTAFAANNISDVNSLGGALYSTYTPKYIAYEVYDATNGNNADQVPFYIKHDGTFTTDNQLNIKGNGTNFNVSDQVFILARAADVTAPGGIGGSAISTAAGTTCAAAIAPIALNDQAGSGVVNYYIVADGSQNSSPVNEITAKILNADQFCARNAAAAGANTSAVGATISVNQAALIGGANFTTAYGSNNVTGNTTLKVNGQGVLNLRVLGGLSATCTTTADVKAAVISNQGNIADTTVLQIKPQFVGTAGAGMQHELSTDDDFKKFLIGTLAVDNYVTTIGNAGDLFTLIDKEVTGADAGKYKAYVPPGQAATLNYTLASLSPEVGVTIDSAALGVKLTKSSDNKTFATGTVNGTSGGFTVATYDTLTVTNAATSGVYSEMLPTNWTLSTFSFLIPGYNVCVNLTGANVGNWYGGIEAIVPFVKANAGGYATYIKLFNRYSKAAKLYVANMNKVSDSIVTSITQLPAPLDAIASKGSVTISADDLMSSAVLTADEAAFGAPVKFLIRVPSQDGGFTGTTNNVVAGPVALGGSVADVTLNLNNVAKASNVDPYITGVVVQVVPGGGQRSISLMFKGFKQGQYHVN